MEYHKVPIKICNAVNKEDPMDTGGQRAAYHTLVGLVSRCVPSEGDGDARTPSSRIQSGVGGL